MRGRSKTAQAIDWPEDDSFYDYAQAARLAMVSPSTLRHWISIGVVTPSRAFEEGGKPRVGFSLADLGYLHLLRHLRKHGVPLEASVELLYHLIARFGAPGPAWRKARLLAKGKHVVAFLPDEWRVTAAIPGPEGAGQKVIEAFFTEVVEQLQERPDAILIPSEFLDFIEMNPNVEGGAPIIRGTRVPTAVIRDLTDKTSVEHVMSHTYPFLSVDQIRTAQAFEEYLDKRAA